MSSTTKKTIDVKRSLVDAILAGLVALIVFGPIVGVVLEGYSFNLQPTRVAWLVAIVMAGRFALSLFLQSPRGLKILEGFETTGSGVHVLPPYYKSRLRWVVPLVIVIAVVFPFFSNSYLLGVVILGLIYVLLGLGLNIVVGLAGLLDLGYVAFYAIGAYGLALGYQYLGLGFWSMLPIAAIMAAMAGALLGFPVLRMHGDYLAIVTLGFGEIIRLVLNNWVSFTGGPNGISAPSPTFFGLEFGRRAKEGGVPIHEFLHIPYNPNLKFIFIYAILILVVLLVLYIKHRLTRMPIGRAWEALREDEIACRAMGLNHVLVKLSAFTLGASTAGIAGVFFATYQGFVNPTSFTFFESALILAIVVLGGMGSTIGVVLAAFVLTVAPELLRSFAEYRVLLFGVLMVVMMIWRPRGLIRISRTGVTHVKEWRHEQGSRPVRGTFDDALRWHQGLERCKPQGRTQLDLRPDRPQRRRQDHGVQLPDRFLQGQWRQDPTQHPRQADQRDPVVGRALQGHRLCVAEKLFQPRLLQDVWRHSPGQPCRAGAHLPEHSPVQGNVGAGEPAGGPAHVGQPQHARRHPQHQGLPQGRERCA